MTDAPYGGLPPSSSTNPITDTAKQQAVQVGQIAKESGQQVAGTAVEQGKNVVAEGMTQARNMKREVTTQVHEQSGAQKDKAAAGLRSLGDELRSMASNGQAGQSGVATDLAQQAATKAHDLAGWLESRDPGTIVDELRSMARRKPGTFLLGAVAAGVVAGRLTRGAVDSAKSHDNATSPRHAASTPTPTVYPTDTPAPVLSPDDSIALSGDPVTSGGLR